MCYTWHLTWDNQICNVGKRASSEQMYKRRRRRREQWTAKDTNNQVTDRRERSGDESFIELICGFSNVIFIINNTGIQINEFNWCVRCLFLNATSLPKGRGWVMKPSAQMGDGASALVFYGLRTFAVTQTYKEKDVSFCGGHSSPQGAAR